jgi:hypothetical protein
MARTPQTHTGTLSEQLERWRAAASDVVIVGDGSGNGWGKACGWCYVLVDRELPVRYKELGGASSGTSGLAELMPFIWALMEYEALHGAKKRRTLGRSIKVTIVTDCRNVADQGNRLVAGAKDFDEIRANCPAWIMLLAFGDLGYQFQFVWEERTTTLLNAFCDDQAGQGRLTVADLAAKALGQVDLPKDVHGRTISLQDLNPDDPDRPVPDLRCVAPKHRKRNLRELPAEEPAA